MVRHVVVAKHDGDGDVDVDGDGMVKLLAETTRGNRPLCGVKVDKSTTYIANALNATI